MKRLLCLFILISFFKGYSQENESETKVAYHSFSFSPAGSYTKNSIAGASFSGDVRFSYGKNLFLIGAEGGVEYFTLLDPADSYYEFNLNYGREFKVYKRLYADFFGGLGYVNQRTYNDMYNSNIGIPLTGVVRVILKHGFSIGLKFHVNLNPDRVIFSTGLHLQFTRKSRSPYK